MSSCPVCDFHGPELPSLHTDQRNLHRALHGLFLALAEALRIDKLVAALDRLLTRKDYPMKRPVSLFAFALWFLSLGLLLGIGLGAGIGWLIGTPAAAWMIFGIIPVATLVTRKAIHLEVENDKATTEALTKILKLHAPEPMHPGQILGPYCTHCTSPNDTGPELYPCATVTAISTALKEYQ